MACKKSYPKNTPGSAQRNPWFVTGHTHDAYSITMQPAVDTEVRETHVTISTLVLVGHWAKSVLACWVILLYNVTDVVAYIVFCKGSQPFKRNFKTGSCIFFRS